MEGRYIILPYFHSLIDRLASEWSCTRLEMMKLQQAQGGSPAVQLFCLRTRLQINYALEILLLIDLFTFSCSVIYVIVL